MLNRRRGQTLPGVRIPLSPPFFARIPIPRSSPVSFPPASCAEKRGRVCAASPKTTVETARAGYRIIEGRILRNPAPPPRNAAYVERKSPAATGSNQHARRRVMRVSAATGCARSGEELESAAIRMGIQDQGGDASVHRMRRAAAKRAGVRSDPTKRTEASARKISQNGQSE